MLNAYEKYICALDTTSKLRKLPVGPTLGKHIFTDFASNDYLGMSKNPDVISAAQDAAKEFGVGATGSRLLTGNLSLFETLEAKIAQDKGSEACLLFNSGFQANHSVLATLLDESTLGAKPLVFFDKYNHSSLYQGVWQSGAEILRFKHNSLSHLTDLLERYKHIDRPKFIVTESVFGMDGDLAPLAEIADLCRNHNALLYIDEAHATGIFGPQGLGLACQLNTQDIPLVIMGTFSKALGGSGAYLCCSHTVKQYLLNKAPGFIYSTAPSPISMAAASKAWDLMKGMNGERKKILGLADKLRRELKELDLDSGSSKSHIIPIRMANENQAVAAKNILLEAGVLVSAIRPPTVPVGTSRLRVALTVNHTDRDIERLLKGLHTL
ncbi:MAG: 8-amino-7-oxononanoate synthase [Pseudomonadota bacterium]